MWSEEVEGKSPQAVEAAHTGWWAGVRLVQCWPPDQCGMTVGSGSGSVV